VDRLTRAGERAASDRIAHRDLETIEHMAERENLLGREPQRCRSASLPRKSL
jgi:hypothetical protein